MGEEHRNENDSKDESDFMKIAYEKRKDIFTHAIAFGKPASTQDNEKKKQNIIAKKNNGIALDDILLFFCLRRRLLSNS